MKEDRRTYLVQHPDSHPHLAVEKGPKGEGVGGWVPADKHRLLADFIEGTSGARGKWPNRVFCDLFSGPGRIQVRGESFTRDGGSLVAWRQSQRLASAAFTHVIVGDKDKARVDASVARLTAAGAPAHGLRGPATETAARAVALIPQRSTLCLAYLDPYNLRHLSFEIIRTLGALPKVDFAVHFSLMDLTRNVEAEFTRGLFDEALPGWRGVLDPKMASKLGFQDAAFDYWRSLVEGQGFKFSERMPIIRNDANKPLYRLVAFSRSGLPNAIWGDVAQDKTRDLFG